jgi:hypothetical protein
LLFPVLAAAGSISEWLSFCIVGGREDEAGHAKDRLIVDWYVVLKTLLVALLLNLPPDALSWCVQGIVYGRSLLLLMFNAARQISSDPS